MPASAMDGRASSSIRTRCSSTKRGIYLVGYSHHHQAIRTFALDGIRAADWRKGDRFDYPPDYDPGRLTEGAFGLVAGERQRVRIAFDKSVSRYVRRRLWHPTQKITATADGVELVLDVAPTFELDNWILSFGDKATVIEPASLRQRVAAQLRRAAALYSASAFSEN